MKKDIFKVAAIQMNCVLGNKEENLNKAYSLITNAAKKQAKLIVLPELFSTGYRVEEKDLELAERFPGDTIDWMKNIAKELDIILVSCITEESIVDGVLYDTAVIVDKSGLQCSYRKIYLWDQENVRFAQGQNYQTYSIENLNIGLQICYEVGFPEGARILTLQGANLLIYPSAFGNARLYAWDIATRARALENGCFVIAANRIGTEKDETTFGGHSRIIDPTGKILAEALDDEEIIIAEIDLSLVKEQRRTIPYLRDLNIPLVISEFNKFK
ncbi:carbon-nitrogen hydrolase family protein [Lysinibacillus telephonicus]|uniref:Carbon-nitrogen hydrolase family protein n=1 Tax=Lysinibacillus telephonicus TaxID=1714840 RepID=A0A431UQM8_9BACI|nr:carbon-nitrogen hydrolase family protein [Lysinibacillus telephonicus]RTQ92443.1 carbon-nitrogen hydrolase family protein [Lysinibacillus telephonicus]